MDGCDERRYVSRALKTYKISLLFTEFKQYSLDGI